VKNAFSDEDEKKMKERLKALGYIWARGKNEPR
jgi:hypothetical protein